jgi:chromate transporter
MAAWHVFLVALGLGMRSFGGPVAHLGYFRDEYVVRRGWLSDQAYSELLALTALLPGPSSSQLGAAIGHLRAGTAGAVAAWLGFTLPSALAMAALGGLTSSADIGDEVWLRALKLVAVAVVLAAVLGMATTMAATRATAAIGALAGVALLVMPRTGAAQLVVLALAAAGGAAMFARRSAPEAVDLPIRVRRRTGLFLLCLFLVLLALALSIRTDGPAQLVAATYRAGALVFGGGHVVLPLLHAEMVPHVLSDSQFLAGYGAVQAVPGPLFTVAAYLGEVSAGPWGALAATVAIFLPGFLVLFGVLPFWQRMRTNRRVAGALAGLNAAVVGLLAAAWIDPVVTGSVHSVGDAVFAAMLFVLLRVAGAPPWVVVIGALAASPLLAL